MSYEEACNSVFTPRQTSNEIIDHGLDPNDFYQEVGQKPCYRGEEILNWLGY